MSNQINKLELVELSAEQQQFLSGGRCHYSPCYKPKNCCGEYKDYKRYTPSPCPDNYPGFNYSDGYQNWD
ncbi:hypothetical protein [Sphaerospermopsis sp. LEGE 08334]|jgi:hypothetical protein|uniref:hypothetical protein n=1 Tax=Sphaerospermopsis sp. LEGE 08334 TaxID=1828651 RepID=UPI00188092C9|nr:hypothetical protein [Sphaerospermopsis sp. LEGE 08334]MBE9059058.1 hypothetical protein [Sphaerospermopsis sp. LEGE 08334]